MSKQGFKVLCGLTLLVLAACAGRMQPVQAPEGLQQAVRQQGVQLELEFSETDRLQGDLSLDGSRAAQAGQQMAQNLFSASQGATTGGGSPANGLGVAIGALLVSYTTVAQADNERLANAEAQIAPVREPLSRALTAGWFESALLAALHSEQINGKADAEYRLRIKPQVVLKEGNQVLLLSSTVELHQGKQLLYSRLLDVYEQGTDCASDCLEQWASDDALLFRNTLTKAIEASVRLLILDWQSSQLTDNFEAERTLRIEFANMRQVERGRLNRADASRVSYLSLNGSIRSFPRSGSVLQSH